MVLPFSTLWLIISVAHGLISQGYRQFQCLLFYLCNESNVHLHTIKGLIDRHDNNNVITQTSVLEYMFYLFIFLSFFPIPVCASTVGGGGGAW
jgi:hypothetical protein